MKPVSLNQLLFHSHTSTLSFYLRPIGRGGDMKEVETFIDDMLQQLILQNNDLLMKILQKHRATIKKIIRDHPEKSHGFFLCDTLQGYIILENQVETYCIMGRTFHVRPLLEELFVNPEFMIVNVSLYDIKVYRGDFHHLEIVGHYEFDQQGLGPQERSRVYAPQNLGIVPYKTVLALKTIAHKVMETILYHSLPVIVTGLDEMKSIFLRHFDHNFGVISHVHEDFYEKTCVQILERCKDFRYTVMDYYSAQFKERLKRVMKAKRLLSDLSDIIRAAHDGRIVHLIIPTERKLWGRIDFESGEFEILKELTPDGTTVDILNELAEEVIKSGGKIQILGPHFFPKDSNVLAILRG